MNTLLKKSLLASAAIAVAWFSIGSPVYARGCRYVETRQGYSYQPAAFGVGDKVVVSVDEAKLMKGTETLAVLKKGQTLEVRGIAGPWLGSEIESDGQKIKGWVWYGQVARAGEPTLGTADRPATAARPGVERRSFSYEPQQRRSFSYGPSYRSYPRSRADSERDKPPWMYPKTDPRRFRP